MNGMCFAAIKMKLRHSDKHLSQINGGNLQMLIPHQIFLQEKWIKDWVCFWGTSRNSGVAHIQKELVTGYSRLPWTYANLFLKLHGIIPCIGQRISISYNYCVSADSVAGSSELWHIPPLLPGKQIGCTWAYQRGRIAMVVRSSVLSLQLV